MPGPTPRPELGCCGERFCIGNGQWRTCNLEHGHAGRHINGFTTYAAERAGFTKARP